MPESHSNTCFIILEKGSESMASVTFEEITSRVNIVDIVQEYIPLKKCGANYKGVCPFHADHDPSLTVNDQKQIFKCFACNVGGDAIKFISLIENISYVDAGIKLCERLGIEYKPKEEKDNEYFKLKKDIKALNKEAARFYFERLKTSEKGIAYLKKRGITPEIGTAFGLGFAEDNWSDLYDHFVKTGISSDLLLKAGLVSKSSKEGVEKYFDKFRGRLIFPIFDEFNEVIAFGGRIVDKADDNIPKYLNSQDTPVYKKGFHLYGMNIAKKSGSKTLIVVEGYMDCIALHTKGINYAVASLGTALTEYQARLIKSKGFTKVILSYDNDNAGKNATLRGMEILKNQGLEVLVFRLKGAKDADEFLRSHSVAEFKKQLDESYSLTEYKILLIAEKFPADTNEHIIYFIKNAKNILSELDETEAKIYAGWITEKYGKDYHFSADDLKIIKSDKPKQSVENIKRVYIDRSGEIKLSETEKKLDVVEKQLIIVISENPSLIENLSDLNEELFGLEQNVNLFRKAVALRKDKLLEGVNSLYDGSAVDSLLAGQHMNFQIEAGKEKAIALELIKKLKINKINNESDEINFKLQNNPKPEELNVLLYRLNELNKLKKELTKGK